ncbi:MAG: AAA family ATPase [Erysipelotrichales bacterium]|nr:AAA family ATPase [Erysipelotrichales bacterium]
MIKLNKIVLINWMYFQKTTLSLEGNTAIVGINGTGKSTIIDAIQMLLLGQRASRFNANANAEKRTLESYVRGAVNMENKEFLRPGDVITYLAFEILLNNETHIFGINIDYKSSINKLSDSKYFYIKGVELNEDLFIENNYPKTYDVFSKHLKAYFEYVPFSTLFQYQTKMKDILGLKDEKKYFQILSHTVGIKSIMDCNNFMNEFVLDDKPIDVSIIKNNILEIDRVSKTIEQEQKKHELLKSIVDLGNQINSFNSEANRYKAKIDLAKLKLLQSDIESKEQECIDLEQKVSIEKIKLSRLQNEKEELQKNNIEYNYALNNVSPDLALKESNLVTLEKLYEENQAILATFKQKCNTTAPLLSTLSKLKESDFNQLHRHLLSGKYSTETTSALFHKFRKTATEIKDTYKSEANKIDSKIENLNLEICELKNIIDKLKNNQFSYNKDIEEFRQYLKSSLEDKYKEKIEIKFLCECLRITDESWRRAIEGYLNTQRFYIIVPNKYYQDAIKLYQNKKDFYATRIINGIRLPVIEFKENTLGAFIESTDNIALNYARFILNKMQCVEDISDLSKFDRAITKDCMYHQNYSVGRLNKKACDEQFIGIEGAKNQLKIKEENLKILIEEKMILSKQYSEFDNIIISLDEAIRFSTSIIENNSIFKSIDEVKNLSDSIQKLKDAIDFYKSNPLYIEIQAKISETIDRISSTINKINEATENITNYNSTRISYENSMIEKRNELKILKDNLSTVDETDFKTSLKQLESEKISKTLIINLEAELKLLDKKIIEEKSNIKNLMKRARDEFSINYEPDFSHFDSFIDEKNKIDDSIFKYQAKLLDIKNKNRNLFFNEFLTKLYNSVDKAKKDIENLNHSLQHFQFGDDRYKIKMSITSNTELADIYNYAKNYNSDDSNRGLFMNFDDEDCERTKVEETLNRYMFSDDLKIQNLVIDYRNYLYFDVEVHSTNGFKSLNKVMKIQSGGEVQVPFYILLGVAFQQTLDIKRNEDVLGIVLYDEAFDKMDMQRIQSMLDFYRKKLKLQIILAAPGKLDSFVDNIDTILAIVKDGDNAVVREVSHELR